MLEEVRALQALAFTSFLFLHAFFYTTFLVIRINMRRSMVVAIGMASLTLLLSLFAYAILFRSNHADTRAFGDGTIIIY